MICGRRLVEAALLVVIALAPGLVRAETPRVTSKSLTPEMIRRIQDAYVPGPSDKRLIDAVMANPIEEIALNQDVIQKHNRLFSHKIKTARVTDQKSTGRCWLYAALNVLRPAVVQKLGDEDFEFSQNYLYFWDKMEKANTFLENAIERAGLDLRDEDYQRILRDPADDGGYWQTFTNLCRKYGVVPQSVMPETYSTGNSRMMLHLVNERLRLAAYHLREMKSSGAKDRALEGEKERVLGDVYRMLVHHLGVPPQEFEFRYEPKEDKKEGAAEDSTEKTVTEKTIVTGRFTPSSFAEAFVLEDLDDYVMIANWPSREFGVLYEVALTRNVMEGVYLNFLNVELEDMKAACLASVLGGDAVDFSADVSHQMDRKAGIMHPDLYRYGDVYGVDLSGTKKVKGILGIVNSNHGMALMGVDMVDGAPVKWWVENSWGADNGDSGYYCMYDGWFDDYVVRAVVKKEYLPERIVALYAQKAVRIPEDEPEQ